MDDPDNKFKVTITWCWEDLLSIDKCKDWSEEKCKRAILIIKKQLMDRSIESGWGIIEALLDTYSEEIE